MSDVNPEEPPPTPSTDYTNLMQALVDLAVRGRYNSEADAVAMGDLLRSVESDLGVSGVVPPARGPINASGDG